MTDPLSSEIQVNPAPASDVPQSLDLESVGLLDRLLAKSPAQRVQELEQLIANALATALRLEPENLRSDESLVSLGLDSLIGMNLRGKLEAALRTELPSFGLGHSEPTVQGLARVAADSIGSPPKNQITGTANGAKPLRKSVRQRRHRSGIVALGGAHRKNAPVFCLHPVGGDLRCYDKLSRHLKSRPVYGLRSRGLDAYSKTHQSMEQLITDYAAEVKKMADDEPICLLGWSTGGIFARELAIRLMSMGIGVESLVMIDTPLPSVFEAVDLLNNSKFLSDLVTFTNYFAGNSMQIDPAILDGLSDDQALATVLDLGIRNGVLPSHATTDFLERLINVCKEHVKILQDYSPAISTIEPILIRPHDEDVLCQAAGKELPPDLGWSEYGVLDLHHVPGHHFTMMTADYAEALASKVEQLIS